MASKTNISSARSWHHCHLTTWLAVAIVAVGLVLINRETQLQWGYGRGWFSSREYARGWPAYGYRFTEIREWISGTLKTRFEDVEWQVAGLAIDSATAVVLLLATGICTERWRRGRMRWWQIDLQSLAILFAIVGALFVLHKEGFFWPYAWSAVGPVMFGIGCVMHFCISLVVASLGLLIRWWQRAPRVEIPGDRQHSEP